MLGDPEKQIQIEEQEMARISRKSLVLNKSLKSGEILKSEFLELRRPGTGLISKDIKNIVGKKAIRNLEDGCQVRISDFYE